ncbi:hypothetical protein Mal64_12810 [Pseudobythopirellula maris]|uniref:DUF8091 domain-containing protein n=1 Tax=Pseudobythopirellula maris TaxID=2527991 RepID=A0A5C5ZX40_9BACT|nr:hypothetical protein [Pseudobythopirellula maris]TWT90883.1 hypothetical protein Mal64_12810 [Pseudobythopirellula maris]
METSLHKQLKEHYAGASGEVEVRRGRYRIDVVRRGTLIEIQHGGLAAIRDKVRRLCEEGARVKVVKPIVALKQIVKLDREGGEQVSRRRSPKRGQLIDLFHDLIHFTRAFPHKKLVLEAVLVEVEETRYPGHGRRRRWRKNDHVVADQRLVAVGETRRFRTSADLLKMLPSGLPRPFDTGELAAGLGVDRWVAQRAAYAMREMGALKTDGKRGNAVLYRPVGRRRAA